MTDYRDELIETQRKVIDSQSATITVLRAALVAAQQQVKQQEQQLAAMRSSNGARKDVQA